MIGNDVVDLGDPESRAEGRHPRFDGRVFDATERALIDASPRPERVRWVLWAAKESAYKAARRVDPRTVFAPSRFGVRFESDARVSVAVGDRRFHVGVAASVDHVHAVARAAGESRRAICTAVARVPPVGTVAEGGGPGGNAARWLAVATLSRALGVAPEDLAIRRDGRIPALWLRGRPSPADLSLSHHGRFVAFACALP